MAEVALVAGCAGRKHDLARDSLSEAAPFSKILAGSGDTVCWCVKRALLSQGYMLDRPDEGGSVLTGTRDFQPQAKLSIAIHLQATCADNRNGTSIVFAIATREDSRLQKMKQSTTVGIGPAMITLLRNGNRHHLSDSRRLSRVIVKSADRSWIGEIEVS